jgi:hypothetical protein
MHIQYYHVFNFKPHLHCQIFAFVLSIQIRFDIKINIIYKLNLF